MTDRMEPSNAARATTVERCVISAPLFVVWFPGRCGRRPNYINNRVDRPTFVETVATCPHDWVSHVRSEYPTADMGSIKIQFAWRTRI